MKQLLITYIKWLLPVLFTGYIGCISLFEHTHLVDGEVIAHAHPFDKNTHHDHQQNKLYIYCIQSISTISAEDGAISTVYLDYHASLISILQDNNCSRSSSFSIKGKSFLRPPPIA